MPGTVTIDHLSFPHIFEAILDASPYPALMKLRQTSRAVQKRADARLCEHITIRENDELWSMARRPGEPGGRIPDRCFLNAGPNTVRVVDLCGVFRTGSQKYEHLANIAVIRRRPPGNGSNYVEYGWLKAAVAIAFVNLFPSYDCFTPQHLRLWPGPYLHCGRTLIANVRFQHPFVGWVNISLDIHSGIQDAVVLFSPMSDYSRITEATTQKGELPSFTTKILDMIADDVAGYLFDDHAIKFTFVGLDDVLATWISHPKVTYPPWIAALEEARSDVPTKFLVHVKNKLWFCGSNRDKADAEVCARVRVLSFTEWRKEVGDWLYDLATVEE